MTERTRDWLSRWLEPHTLITLASFLILLGVAWHRLGAVEDQLKVNTSANQTAALELVRYQERISYLSDRIGALETKISDQDKINARVWAGLKTAGGS